tara:strand:- start:8605 stop:9222 length:618 start_codon:yes stop_codon:yes gene_type:complete
MNNLAQGTEPLTLADGTVIDPVDGTPVIDRDDELVEVPTVTQIQRDYVVAARRLSDLPVAPHKLNTISMILTYSLLGISDADIGITLGLEEAQVGRIRMSDPFAEIRDEVIHNIVESDSEAVRGMISQGAMLAATRMLGALNSPNEATQVHASKDILDRAGHRAADIVEHRHNIEGGLRIEYVTKDDNAIPDTPVIDITPERSNG